VAIVVWVAVSIEQIINNLAVVIKLREVGKELFVQTTINGNHRVHCHSCSGEGNLVLSIFCPLYVGMSASIFLNYVGEVRNTMANERLGHLSNVGKDLGK
jgi:hypothetical protein